MGIVHATLGSTEALKHYHPKLLTLDPEITDSCRQTPCSIWLRMALGMVQVSFSKHCELEHQTWFGVFGFIQRLLTQCFDHLSREKNITNEILTDYQLYIYISPFSPRCKVFYHRSIFGLHGPAVSVPPHGLTWTFTGFLCCLRIKSQSFKGTVGLCQSRPRMKQGDWLEAYGINCSCLEWQMMGNMGKRTIAGW